MVTLRGERLRFDPEDPRESLVFENEEIPNQKVLIAKPFRISGVEISFLLPPIPFAEGRLVLANTLGSARLRSGRSELVRVGLPPLRCCRKKKLE